MGVRRHRRRIVDPSAEEKAQMRSAVVREKNGAA
jgi:hypothetical protein